MYLYIFYLSFLFGGLITFSVFASDRTNSNYLTTKTINIIYICFIALVAVGICVFGFLRKPVSKHTEASNGNHLNSWSRLFGTFSTPKCKTKVHMSNWIEIVFCCSRYK